MPPTDSEISDSTLIECLRADDLDALGVLFNRYYPQVYRTALGITHDAAAADDIAQDCFLRLHRYAQRVDTSLPLMPWLYRVTVNLSYTWVSRQHRRRVSLDAVVNYLLSPARAAPENVAEHASTRREVRAAIAALHFNQRVVVVLYYLNSLSVEEIADILDCPVGTVKSRLYYARENLRQRLGSAYGGETWMHQYAD